MLLTEAEGAEKGTAAIHRVHGGGAAAGQPAEERFAQLRVQIA